jgi:hypothetical protein
MGLYAAIYNTASVLLEQANAFLLLVPSLLTDGNTHMTSVAGAVLNVYQCIPH